MIAAIVALSLHSVSMKDVIYLLFHLLTTIAKLIQPGGSHAVIAENLLLKQQLIIHDDWPGQRSSSSHLPCSIFTMH
jgi:hypothetical protein